VIIADDRTQLLSTQLLDLLRSHLGDPSIEFDGTPAMLTGGFWAELVRFRIAPAPEGWGRPMVARVMPDPAIAAKEGAFQLEVATQGYPTPPVRLQRGPEDGIDGRAVMIMDLADGAPLLSGLDGLTAIARFPSLARRLPVVLGRVSADLHRLDPCPVMQRLDASDAPRPDVDGMLTHLQQTAEELDRPLLASVARWLADHQPPTDGEVICHGDLHPFNVLVADDHALTVLDWSAAVIAPREYDLGFTSLMLAEPPLVVPPPLRAVVRRAGRALSKRFVRQYEGLAGVRVDRGALAWNEALIGLRARTEVAGWAVAGVLAGREGHPWVINEEALIGRLTELTGIVVPRERRT
jgi:aminoglycoside phosphotransferase (APT) family kinase protein